MRVWEFPEPIKKLLWSGDPEDALSCDCCCDEHFGCCEAGKYTAGLACKGDHSALPSLQDILKLHDYYDQLEKDAWKL